MPYTDDNPQPLHIVEGVKLHEIEERGTQYGFQFKNFDGIAINRFPSNKEDWEAFFPRELNEMLAFQSVSDAIGSTKEYIDWDNTPLLLDKSFLDSAESGCVTKNGSIIPQIVAPFNLCDNLVLSSNADENMEIRPLEWRRVLTKEDADEASPNMEDYAHSVTVNSSNAKSHFLRMHGRRRWDPLKSYTHTFEARFPDCSAFAILCDIFQENDLANSSSAKFIIYQKDEKTVSPKNLRQVSIEVKNRVKTDMSIGNEGSASGTLQYGKDGMKPLFCKYSFLKDKNAVMFAYPLVNKMVLEGELSRNSHEDGHILTCLMEPDMNLPKKLSPSIDKFPGNHKLTGSDCIMVSSDAYVKLGNCIRATFNNCSANFGVAQLRFAPRMKFSYFYRVTGKNNLMNMAPEVTEGLDTKDYYCLVVGGNLVGYEGYNTKFYSRKVYSDADRDESIYRIDFDIGNESGRFQKDPLEILGMIHIVKRTGKLADIRAGNGDFSEGFSRYNPADGDLDVYTRGGGTSSASDWTTYITSIDVKHGMDGSSGSITLDKYMMYESLGRVTTPVIGALTLVARNGYYEVNPGKKHFSSLDSEVFGTMPEGQIFKGFVTEVQDSTSEGNAQIILTLSGIQKKLEDMKHINCPYWDGDYVFEDTPYSPLNYLRSYSGCDLVYKEELSRGTVSRGNPTDGKAKRYFLPRSISYQNPCVHYTIGTSILESLNQLAPLVNHRFVIQPDGRGYFYGLNEFGLPTWVENGPVRITFHESELESLSLTPFLDNHFNSFVTLGVKGVYDAKNPDAIIPDPNQTFPLLKYYERKRSALEYPWSKILVKKVDGILPEKDFMQQHKININYGGKIVYTGSITIPGYEQLFIFDRINIKKNDSSSPMEFYITDVSHSINLSSKEWKTTIGIAGIHSTGSAVQIGDL